MITVLRVDFHRFLFSFVFIQAHSCHAALLAESFVSSQSHVTKTTEELMANRCMSFFSTARLFV